MQTRSRIDGGCRHRTGEVITDRDPRTASETKGIAASHRHSFRKVAADPDAVVSIKATGEAIVQSRGRRDFSGQIRANGNETIVASRSAEARGKTIDRRCGYCARQRSINVNYAIILKS